MEETRGGLRISWLRFRQVVGIETLAVFELHES